MCRRGRPSLVAALSVGAVALLSQPGGAQLEKYGVLKARPIERRSGSASSPYYQMHVVAGRDHFRVVLSLASRIAPTDLQVAVIDGFQHPITATLQSLDDGQTPLSADSRKGLDYIRGGLFTAKQLQKLNSTQLAQRLEAAWSEASTDPAARLYAFGNFWGPDKQRDPIFGFQPARGVHDVHMNQGNAGAFAPQDGVYQDGGLLFEIPSRGKWWAFFAKFQSQSLTTHDVTGSAPASGVSTLPGASQEDRTPADFTTTIGWVVGVSLIVVLVVLALVVARRRAHGKASVAEVPHASAEATAATRHAPRLFISYRRQDIAHARLIRDRIRGDQRFSDAEVFFDIQSLQAGEHFKARIKKRLDECDAVIALIGPAWIARAAELQDDDDILRFELTAALARGVPVLPITVAGTTLPSSVHLPSAVAPLLERNVLDLPEAYYDEGTRKLLDRLESITAGTGA